MPKNQSAVSRKPRAPQTKRNTSGLKPFQPGQSGNPGGRPKKMPITDAIREELEQEGAQGTSNARAIARKLVKLARAGNMDAIREIADRTEGKPRQRIEQSGPEGGPVQLQLPTTRAEVERRIIELEARMGAPAS
jgi:hypothetical protein